MRKEKENTRPLYPPELSSILAPSGPAAKLIFLAVLFPEEAHLWNRGGGSGIRAGGVEFAHLRVGAGPGCWCTWLSEAALKAPECLSWLGPGALEYLPGEPARLAAPFVRPLNLGLGWIPPLCFHQRRGNIAPETWEQP